MIEVITEYVGQHTLTNVLKIQLTRYEVFQEKVPKIQLNLLRDYTGREVKSSQTHQKHTDIQLRDFYFSLEKVSNLSFTDKKH